MKDFLKHIIQEAVREADITEEIENTICGIDVQGMVENHLRDYISSSMALEEDIEEKLEEIIEEELMSYAIDCILKEKIDDFFR